ncbi:hypothetical protein CesoFtcFv8_006041 [Champsocephalus esox]|uniref:von Willebrand factor A domain-containing protein 5A-like n=1 Tax=Champsocephalus esox TaxID=159716 RepID=A0AAN8CIQ2_9TELE|nr:hypothetical protein CesoFtcFv8_006041 [Champsocephalus esox]
MLSQSPEAAEGSVTVKYSLAGHPSQNKLHFSLKPAEDSGLTVHRLAARTLIRSLEMEEMERRGQPDEGVEKKVVELSVQSGVSSTFTAFIAVNKGNGETIQGPLVRRNVPTSMPMMALCGGGPPGGRMMSMPRIHYQCSMPMRKIARSSAPMNSSVGHVLCSLSCDSLDIEPQQPPRDPLLQLVSLQKASGCWELDPALAAAVGKTSEEVENTKPASENKEVWATILALIWLHGFKMDAQEEWELLAMKAVSWLRAQNAPCVAECVEAGNTLLGCKVQKDALGI